MTQTLANRMTTNPQQPFTNCASLPIRQEGLTTNDLCEFQGGTWVHALRWAITAIVGFEAGYQYGKVRDAMGESSEDQEQEQEECYSLSFHTADPDNTRVGG